MDYGTLAQHAARYVELAGAALAVGIIAGIPLGIAAARARFGRAPILALANIGRVVPSLALLTFMIPLLGFGFVPALAALSLLALAPIALTADVAFRGVSASAIDAARGMGMTNVQIFARVEWPLAFPVLFSGVRTAATEVVASAVLASFIGAGGLGDDIQSGLQANLPETLWSAAIVIACIALLTEAVFSQAARRLELPRA